MIRVQRPQNVANLLRQGYGGQDVEVLPIPIPNLLPNQTPQTLKEDSPATRRGILI